jgi:hypothetical protein
MLDAKLKSAYVLSSTIAILAAIAAAGGLFIDDLYRDNRLVTLTWFGNDWVTLIVAVPILVIALILSARGSQRAQLVWLGMLDYTLYNFGFYLFGSAYNRFFLIYVALLALSIFALIFGLTALDVNAIGRKFRATAPVKWVSVYMLLLALILGGHWIVQSLNFILTGQLPPVMVRVNGSTNVIAALDLSLVVPEFMLGAIWLWQRQSWGYVLGIIANVKGALYMLALTTGSLFAAQTGAPGSLELVPLWSFLCVASLTASLFLLGNFNPAHK